MKNKFLVILLFFIVSGIFSQTKITRKFTTTQVEKIDLSKIYSKKTGEKIKKKKYIELVKNNPHIQLERVYGVDKKVVKYLLDFTKTDSLLKNYSTKSIIEGELFPNFIAQTIDKKKIELNKLRGKIVILRFELEANSFRFKKQEIKQIDNLINKIKNKSKKVEAIIFFASNKSDIKKGFDLPNSNFQLIPNSLNFQEKYSITRFPSTILIDKNGKLVKHYKFTGDINLKEMINE
jgi:peroxiredoxin